MPNFERRVLVLDSRYEPVKVVSVHTGFVLLYTERASTVVESPRVIRSVSSTHPVPWIIRLHNAAPRKRRMVGPRFSRQNIYLRDGYRCQYCNWTGSVLNLTMDHLIPLARGGKTTWENIVTACKHCNLKKGSRTIEELGLRLPRMPERPRFNGIALFALRYGLHRQNIPQAWVGYVDLSISDRLLEMNIFEKPKNPSSGAQVDSLAAFPAVG